MSLHEKVLLCDFRRLFMFVEHLKRQEWKFQGNGKIETFLDTHKISHTYPVSPAVWNNE